MLHLINCSLILRHFSNFLHAFYTHTSLAYLSHTFILSFPSFLRNHENEARSFPATRYNALLNLKRENVINDIPIYTHRGGKSNLKYINIPFATRITRYVRKTKINKYISIRSISSVDIDRR